MVGLMVGPNRVTRWKTRGRRGGGLGPVGAQSEAIWKASAYTGVTPSWLKDLKGNGHHMRLGSVGRAEIVDGALVLNGVAGQYASTPDDNSLDIVGDLTLTAKLTMDDWTPATNMAVISKWGAGGSRSYQLGVLVATGVLFLNTSTDGTAVATDSSTVAPTIADGDTLWVRAAIDVNDGGGNRIVKFFTSPSGIDGTWTQLGTTVTAAATTIFSSGQILELGAQAAGTTNPTAGKIGRAIVHNGYFDGTTQAGTTVFDADFSNKSDGTPWFLEATGKRVTVQPARAAVVDGALWLPGVVGQYAVTADHASLDITGDIDIIVRASPDDWAPGTAAALVSKENVSTQRSFNLRIAATPSLMLSTDGTAEVAATSSAAVPFTAGQVGWLRATWRASDGRVQFFTSSDGTAWTQLGTNQTIAVPSIFNSTTPLHIGIRGNGTTQPLFGKVYRAIVKSGIDGTTVFDCDFSTWANGDGMGGYPEFDATGKAVAVLSDTTGADTNDPKWLKYHDARTFMCGCMKGLYLPGVSGNYASVPDSAPLDIVGDITLDAEVALDDWTPSGTNNLVGKWGAVGQQSYLLRVSNTGALTLFLSNDGTAGISATSPVVPAVDGQRLWVRASWKDSTNTAKFFTSPSGLDGSWTQLGTDQALASAGIFASTQVVEVGSQQGGTVGLASGRFFRARIYDGYFDGTTQGGSLVLDADFTLAAVAEPYASFITTTGQTVTINRSATGRKAAVVDRPMFLFGTDDYMECAGHTDLDFGAAQSFSTAVALRSYAIGAGTMTLLARRPGYNAPDVGWIQFHSSGARRMEIADGVNEAATPAVNSVEVSGSAQLASVVEDRVGQTLVSRVDVLAPDSVSSAPVGSLISAQAVRIARTSGAGAQQADIEFFGSGVWRKALSASEVATLDAEFRTNV